MNTFNSPCCLVQVTCRQYKEEYQFHCPRCGDQFTARQARDAGRMAEIRDIQTSGWPILDQIEQMKGVAQCAFDTGSYKAARVARQAVISMQRELRYLRGQR